MFLFTGIEDNTKDETGLTPWRREITGRNIEFWKIGENGIEDRGPHPRDRVLLDRGSRRTLRGNGWCNRSAPRHDRAGDVGCCRWCR
jgi:hypothetical protein